MTTFSDSPTLLGLMFEQRKLLAGAAIAGALAAAVLTLALPPRYRAVGVVRVASVDGQWVIDPPTVASELMHPRPGTDALGPNVRIEATALFKTDLVRLTVLASDKASAEQTLETVTKDVAAKLNLLTDQMVNDGYDNLRQACSQVVIKPVLRRPATRLEPLGTAENSRVPLSTTVAVGFGLGWLVGFAVALFLSARRV